MQVIKRDGSAQKYDPRRIKTAIKKAVVAAGEFINPEVITAIIEHLDIYNGIKVEEIQDKVERQLMLIALFKSAKAYILYREERKNDRRINGMKDYIHDYLASSNAATGSKFDSNANVTEKNVTTLSGELFKGEQIALNRSRMFDMNKKLWGEEVANKYNKMLENHELYKHDETSAMYPYCVAITMYPMLIDGLKNLGGISEPPKHMRSFCGIFVNMVFTIAAQFAGAIATPEFLMYFDYFARKEWGEEYYLNPDKKVELYIDDDGNECWRTIEEVVKDYLQNVVYYLNQPAAARNWQSVFWNISYFDKNYFEGIFGDFHFPDGSKPKWESLDYIQRFFMRWFNEERTIKLLTFPVETMALLTDGEDVLDKEYADLNAEMYSEGHSFFTYTSDSADSLSSCCRLRSEMTDNQFSYSLGAGGVATGSKSVITLNINRLTQDAAKKQINLLDYIREQVKLIHKFQTSYNTLLQELKDAGALTVYNAGFIDMKKQYLTIGVNGVIEAAEFSGIKVSDNKEYQEFISAILGVISEENKTAKTDELMFNTEFVPAENLGVKHAKWDKEAGYIVPRACYNSYFYAVEDNSLSIIDKFKLHGKEYVERLDGGSALHLNLEEHLSQDQYRYLLKLAARLGTNYFTYNIPNTICNECGHIDKRMIKACPKCGSTNIDYATRIIGYLKRVSAFSEARQREANIRHYIKE